MHFLQGDFREDEVLPQLEQRARRAGRSTWCVSDMAPNLSGIEASDAARIGHLVELAVEFALRHLKPEGALVCKVFHGSGYSQLVKLFKDSFRVVKPIKPKASRDKSAETFLVGIGLEGPRRPREPGRDVRWQSRACSASRIPTRPCRPDLTGLESTPYAVDIGAARSWHACRVCWTG